ncbi:vWA domain-containing protein [Atopobium fossor]|uniref:vWA domain-containing protein n=1 Tax=Atopobium fossor TaxID=39487 RepID=UPI0003FAF996|nr:VWA-like domain-containing protein [Atopobium fossor]
MDSHEQTLALRIMQLTQETLVAHNHFLAGSIALLRLEVQKQSQSFSTNGSTLFIDAHQVISAYLDEQQPPVHDYVHVLAHCLFLHPFVGTRVQRKAWSLACDIVAEMVVADIVGSRTGERGSKIEATLESLYDNFAGKLTAERLYHSFISGGYSNMLSAWEPLFFVDDHSLWFTQDSQTTPQQQRNTDALNNQDSATGLAAHTPSKNSFTDSDKDSCSDQQQPTASPTAKDADFSLTPEQIKRAEESWSKAAQSMRVDLETLSRKRGSKLRGLMHQLKVSQHEEVDYREFLRQFATYQEDMRLSEDEFDYVFYTYGLSLYKDMPLIEPLEYSNKNRIRDFVIVIDTSSSVTGKIVQQFVDTTYDVLCSTESFFEKINVHIIQCDLQVRSDTKITSVAEMNQWRRKIDLHGFSGTDFRPAFRYVQELRQKGEFDDLAGVIYFTDGWGTYPETMPPFKTAFVFYDEDHRPDLVPAWAIQLTINSGQFESMSVY